MSPNRLVESTVVYVALWSFCAFAQAAEPPAPAVAPPPAPQQQQEQQQVQQQQALEQQLAAARQRLETAAREVGQLSEQLGRQAGDHVFERFGGPPRAIIGMQLQEAQGGARVTVVSPGGAAAEAGIRQGDIITAVGGADVSKEANPARAVVERTRDLAPGLKVKVAALRDGRKMDFDVTPRKGPQAYAFGGVAPMPGMPGVAMRGGPVQHFGLQRFGRDDGSENFRGMEFATLSEKLGGYFGVKSGVLVVRAGEGSTFKLQDGDVIVSIDGREPTSAAHATRILRSYQPGEKLSLKVQRDRKAQNVEVTLPGRGPDRD